MPVVGGFEACAGGARLGSWLNLVFVAFVFVAFVFVAFVPVVELVF